MSRLFCYKICEVVQVGVESAPALICSRQPAKAAGVHLPPPADPPPKPLLFFPKENAFNQSWVTLQTSEKRQECPAPSKGSIWTFLYLQLKREQFSREGCKDGLQKEGMMAEVEGRGGAGMSAPVTAAHAAKDRKRKHVEEY